MNKKGERGMGAGAYVLVFLLILGIAFQSDIRGFFGAQAAVPAPTQGAGSTGATASGAAACGYQPTVTVTAFDAIQTSTNVSGTTNYFLNGKYMGTSAPAVLNGDKWDIIVDPTSYLAAKGNKDIGCGANIITANAYAYANATVTVKDDPVTSSNTLTNGAGTYNATKINGQRNLPVYFQGTSQKSTGKIFWLVESPTGMAVNMTSVSASCNGQALPSVAIPNAIAAANAGSLRAAFEVPAVVGSASTQCNLQLQSTATGVMNGLFKNTFYAEQIFVNADGIVQEGIYDTSSNGNNAAKYQDTYTYNVGLY